MTDIHNTTNGLWETNNQENNQQNNQQNTTDVQNQEMIRVFESYLDNQNIVLWLSEDPRTPPIIIQQIAFQTIDIKARNNAIRMIVNAGWDVYAEDVFTRIMQIREVENTTVERWHIPPYADGYMKALWYVIATWWNTPSRILERISLHSNNHSIQDTAISGLVNDTSHQYDQEIYQSILRIIEQRFQKERESNTRDYSYQSLSEILLWWECVPLRVLQEVIDLANASENLIQRTSILECLMDNERNPYITREFYHLIRKMLIHI